MAAGEAKTLQLGELAERFFSAGRPHRLGRPFWSGHLPFAAWIVERTKPGILVELGTETGVSYSAFLDAVRRHGLPTKCFAVDTWRGDAHAGAYGDEIFEDVIAFHRPYESFSTLVRSTFDEALSRFEDGSIDLLHIDGFHTYEAVRHDFESWLPKMSSRGVVLMHDIAVRAGDFGVWRFWEELTKLYPSFAFDHSNGLGVLAVGTDVVVPELFSATDDEKTALRRSFEWLGSVTEAWALLSRAEAEHRELQQQAVAAHTRAAANQDTAEQLQKALAITGTEKDQLSRELAVAREEARVYLETMQASRRESDELRSQVTRAREVLLRTARELSETRARLVDFENSHSQRTHEERCLSSFRTGKALFAAERFLGKLRRRWLRWKGVPRVAQSDRELILESGLFDPIYYFSQYPDVTRAGVDPLDHYLEYGVKEDRAPHALFDPLYYKHAYPDVRASEMNPLVHFLKFGAREGRWPSQFFDTGYYLESNPDVAASGANPLVHYVRCGAQEGRSPHPFFDPAHYDSQRRACAC